MTAARLIEIPCKHIASILEVHCKLGVLVKYNWFQTSVHYVEKQQAKFGVVNEVRIRHVWLQLLVEPFFVADFNPCNNKV